MRPRNRRLVELIASIVLLIFGAAIVGTIVWLLVEAVIGPID